MDHGASNYLPDLTYLESKGMLKEDSDRFLRRGADAA